MLLQAFAIRFLKQIEAFAATHKRASTPGARAPQRTMLVRLPADAKPNQRLATKTPRGDNIDFVVPPNGVPGSIIQLRY